MVATEPLRAQEEHGKERQGSWEDQDGGTRPPSSVGTMEQADLELKVIHSPPMIISETADDFSHSDTAGVQQGNGKSVDLIPVSRWADMADKAETEGVELVVLAVTDSAVTFEILALNEGDLGMTCDKTRTALGKARGPESEAVEPLFLLSDRLEEDEEGHESDSELGLKDLGEGNNSKTSETS
ncbi:hypothetical protein NDU88_000956 [Pleurodeles waltl]|uniref:Uncharacterized protein n=1 Tax=Pleurodeles waltl TaxID=8319 RepID=A0AAV7N9G2_PLEWA|nr:hypothetical protein NDU88_000956 [Pleurodeles waltl]